MIDDSLAKGLATRWIKEVGDAERFLRKAIGVSITTFQPTTKGAKKAIGQIVKLTSTLLIDHMVSADGASIRLCYPSIKENTDNPTDIAVVLETTEISPKKSAATQLGLTVRLSTHSIRRLIKRAGEQNIAERPFDPEPMMEAIRDANLWIQTMVNAMRFGQLLIQKDSNSNLIIPTRHGAFAGVFTPSMSTIDIRSFLGENELKDRFETVENCSRMMRENGVDLSWVSNSNYKDPRVIAAFIMAEDAGIFSVEWNRNNDLKDTKIDLEAAKAQLIKQAALMKPIRTGVSHNPLGEQKPTQSS